MVPDDPEPITDWAGLEILAVDACRDRLRHAHVARIGFLDHGEMSVLPVNIAMDDHDVVFRTGPGSKLSAAAMGSPVCVEIDGWDDLSHTGWSVLARGTASTVDDDHEIARLDQLPVRPWATPDQRTHWVRVTVNEITGRRIAGHG